MVNNFGSCVVATAISNSPDHTGAMNADQRAAAIALATVVDRIARIDAVPPRRVANRRTITRRDGAPVWLSVSHREGRATAAASEVGPVGIDLELASPIPNIRSRYFTSAAERRRFPALPLAVLWSLKEAAWKALELDDATPFTDLTLDADADGSVREVRVGARRRGARADITSPWPGWIMTVVQLEPLS